MKRHSGIAILCGAVALSAAVVAGLGVFARGDGSTQTVTSVRGETYEMVTTGVYAFNAERVVAEGIGWDVFTLFIAVPAMLLCIPRLGRGSFRAQLFALGLLAYFFYQYFMYALTWAVGPLLLPFMGIFVASLGGIVWIASELPKVDLATRFTDRFPRRGIAILSALLAVMLVGMWLQRISLALKGDFTNAMLLGNTTLVVQVLDLGLVVPASLLTAVLAWRRRPVGYVLASVFVVKVVAMALAILAMLVGALLIQGKVEVAPFFLFGGAAIAAMFLGVKMYRSTRDDGEARAKTSAPRKLATA